MRPLGMIVAGLAVIAAGCAGEEQRAFEPRQELTVVSPPADETRTLVSPAPPKQSRSNASVDEGPAPQDPSWRPADGVVTVFDKPWLVVEGVWDIGFDYPRGDPFVGQRNGLLGGAGGGAVTVFGPALYGKYAVRVVLHPTRRPPPPACEDVVEASLPGVTDGVGMQSFETGASLAILEPGDYRVRYCAVGLDLVVTETAESESDGDDWRLYSGSHLFQIWPEPRSPDRIVRVGSTFAADQHRRVQEAGGDR